jgi:dipeptide/tripeptide permease
VFVYGFAGWLADRWLGTSFLVAVGIIVGAVLGLYLTWNRFNRPSAGDGDTK